jgi:hypothetical protein
MMPWKPARNKEPILVAKEGAGPCVPAALSAPQVAMGAGGREATRTQVPKEEKVCEQAPQLQLTHDEQRIEVDVVQRDELHSKPAVHLVPVVVESASGQRSGHQQTTTIRHQKSATLGES